MEGNDMSIHPIEVEKVRVREFPLRWLAAGAVLFLAVGAWLLLSKDKKEYVVGQQVLAHCRDTYLLGWIKRVRNSGYEVKFGSDTRPITCTPYLWKADYLSAYQPSDEYLYQDLRLHRGDRITLAVKVEKRPLPLKVEILDLTADGFVRLRPVDGGPLARGFFDKHVGSKFIRIERYPLYRRS